MLYCLTVIGQSSFRQGRYVMLIAGRKVETYHRPGPELFSIEQNRRWSVCQDKGPSPYVYRQSHNAMVGDSNQRFRFLIGHTGYFQVPVTTHNQPSASQAIQQQPKTSFAQSSEQLMRKLADLQQQRDHIDGYIDWLKAEARKKEVSCICV